MVFFTKIYALSIEKAQYSGPKNDHAMRKSPEKSFWVRASIYKLCKEDPLKLYKNESATESEKRCQNAWLWNMVFFALFKQKKNVCPKITMPCGNLQDIMFGLGLWYSFCAKKTIESCIKWNLQGD
jgi:hypothetical protein